MLVVAEEKGWNPSEFKDDKFPTEILKETQYNLSLSAHFQLNSVVVK